MSKYDQLQAKILPLLIPYANHIALFGSVVRGEETAESDLDILIRLKPGGERAPLGLKWFRLEEELGQLVGRKVDLISDEALSPYLRPYVEKEKVILYEG